MGYPTADQVLLGVVFGASNELTGTLRVPTAAQVKNGVSFGPADALTGTVTLPAVGRVLAGWSYGAGGVEFTGTYDANLPSPNQVVFGVGFGPSGDTETGNVVLPAPEAVQFGVHYGPQNAEVGAWTGEVSVPSAEAIVDALLARDLGNERQAEGSVGEALQAARAATFGDRAMVGSTMRYYGPDGTTVQKTMNVDDPTNPQTITDGD